MSATLSSDPARPFFTAAQEAKGPDAARLIEEATAAPHLWLYAPFTRLPAFHELSRSPELEKQFRLLQLFAFGTWSDYIASKDSLPQLNDAQAKKLKLLTLTSLASSKHLLSYDYLLEQLQFPSQRYLEDAIIEAIYEGLIAGRLDQAKKRLEIEWVKSRDISVENNDDVPKLLEQLQNWHNRVEQVLSILDNKIDSLHQAELQNAEDEQSKKSLLESMGSSLSTQSNSNSNSRTNDGDMDVDKERSRSTANRDGRTRKRTRPSGDAR